ncbi:imidazolonepropionase-like amidohydrolase [Thermocatellispora tengchongensis]|uniref:Imidazolonepropionase-like amidohydrolase n=1 Tax=Thermocatellispora tengchongensis TaxID=1073253 RepID=A0A840P4H3_9ACTN|nr:amidohydrolase family protein [Thermocatellispora tengchongensis]MBB5134262.1 imidazolonepropionase-like amidohydrolase [Thermocatellispora tengchongensis]
MSRTVLVNCTVVDARERPVSGAAVLIDGGRIAAVGPYAEVMPAAGDAVVLDLGGAYVTPGLVNMHTHLSLSLPGPGGESVRTLGPYELALYMADGARRTLHSGVTTVRCVAEKDHADFALRRAITAGRVPGPRIFTAGRALVCTGGHGHEGSDTLECDGPDAFRRGVRAQIKAGADLIKVMISGGIAGEHERIDTPQLFADEMRAVLETAHAWGRKVTAHAGPAPVVAQAVELGLDCVEHGYQLTPEVVAAMAARGTALVPTLLVTRCKAFFDELGVPEWMQARSLGAGPRHLESYAMALEAGVEVLLGSDMPPFWDFEGTSATVRELEHMAEGGLSPARALYAATLGPIRWLGAEAELGTVEPGKHADLIAMDADPLASASAFRSIRWVMKGGEVVRDDRAAVPPDPDPVAAAIDDMYDAFLAADRARFDSHLHPEVTTWETHLPGPLRTRAELDAYREARDSSGERPALARLAAEDKRIDVWGEVAVARYVLVAEQPGAPAERTRVTDVLRRTGGAWRIAHHHAELLH